MEQKDINTIYPDNHSIEHLIFVFSQAEKRLEDSNKAFEFTTNKTFTVMSIIVAILTAITTYFISEFDINGVFAPKVAVAAFSIIFLFVILFRVSKNIKSEEYNPLGSYPSILYTECPKELTSDLHYKDILHSEIIGYGKRISFNEKINETRTKILDKCIMSLVFYPIVAILVYILFLYCSSII